MLKIVKDNVASLREKSELVTLPLSKEDENLLNHKVLLFLLEPGEIDKNIAGLIANKMMAKYQRPCCILTKRNGFLFKEISG